MTWSWEAPICIQNRTKPYEGKKNTNINTTGKLARGNCMLKRKDRRTVLVRLIYSYLRTVSQKKIGNVISRFLSVKFSVNLSERLGGSNQN